MGEQLESVEGLVEESGHAGFEGADAVTGIIEGGEHQNRNPGRVVAAFQEPCRLQTIHLRHHEIHEDQVGFTLHGNIDRLPSISGLNQVIGTIFQRRANSQAIDLVVIGNQDERRITHG